MNKNPLNELVTRFSLEILKINLIKMFVLHL